MVEQFSNLSKKELKIELKKVSGEIITLKDEENRIRKPFEKEKKPLEDDLKKQNKEIMLIEQAIAKRQAELKKEAERKTASPKKEVTAGEVMRETIAAREGMIIPEATPIDHSAPEIVEARTLEHEMTSESPKETPTIAESPLENATDYETFKKHFLADHTKTGLGKIVPDIERLVPGFNDLAPGAKMLTIQSMTDRMYERVTEEARNTYNEKLADLGVFGNVEEGSGFLGKLKKKTAEATGKIINGIRYGLRKNYLTSTYEKQALTELLGKERENFIAENGNIAKTFKEHDIDARLYADGRTLYIDYAKQANETGDNKVIADIYNHRATELSRIPSSWGEEGAAFAEKRKYQKAKDAFDEAERAMASVFKKRNGGNEQLAALEASKVHFQIQAMNTLVKNPIATEALGAIATRTKGDRIDQGILKYWKNEYAGDNLKYTLSTGAAYAVAGTALAGTASLGIPLVALVTGAVGHRRGVENAKKIFFHEKELAAVGKAPESKTKPSMTGSKIRLYEIKEIADKLASLGQNNGSPIEIAKLRERLRDHVEFIKEKNKAGEINYGKGNDAFGRKLELLMTMHEAEVTLATLHMKHGAEEAFRTALETADPKRTRVLTLLAERRKKTKQQILAAQEKEISSAAWKSAWLGAAFGSAGAVILDWFHGSAAPHAIEKAATRTAAIATAGVIAEKHPEQQPPHTEEPLELSAPKMTPDQILGTGNERITTAETTTPSPDDAINEELDVSPAGMEVVITKTNAERNFTNDLDRFFGKKTFLGHASGSGELAPAWSMVLRDYSAKHLLENKLSFRMQPEYQRFFNFFKKIAKLDPNGPADESVSVNEWLRHLEQIREEKNIPFE